MLAYLRVFILVLLWFYGVFVEEINNYIYFSSCQIFIQGFMDHSYPKINVSLFAALYFFYIVVF